MSTPDKMASLPVAGARAEHPHRGRCLAEPLAQDGRDARKNRVHRTPKCAELPEKYGARQQEFMRALYTGIRADEAEQAAGVLARMLQNLEKMQTVEEGLE